MFRPKRLVAAVSVAVFTVLLTSCSRPPTSGELVGTWVATRDSMKYVPGGGDCRITFNVDGTFLARVPDRFVSDDRATWRLITGKGKWLFPSKYYPDSIRLEFQNVDGQSVNSGSDGFLMPYGSGDRLGLFFYVKEEGGHRFEFERAPTASTAPTTRVAP